MKAEELHVGDWVMWKSNIGGDFSVERVNAKHLNPRPFGVGVEVRGMSIQFATIEPIPVTKEILEANGFKRFFDQIYKRSIDKYNYLQVRLGDDYSQVKLIHHVPRMDFEEYGYESNIEISERLYVHKMQHVLRLFGLYDLDKSFTL